MLHARWLGEGVGLTGVLDLLQRDAVQCRCYSHDLHLDNTVAILRRNELDNSISSTFLFCPGSRDTFSYLLQRSELYLKIRKYIVAQCAYRYNDMSDIGLSTGRGVFLV